MLDVPTLEALRAEIDALDHSLLEVLARRMAVVDTLAALKRAQTLPLRDVAREHVLLTDRARRAASLGLSRTVSDTVFRAVLRESRARLRARGVPATSPSVGTRMRRVLSRALARWLDTLDA